MIGGEGERKTLRIVAWYAQAWNGGGSVDFLRHKVEVLRRHCDTVGRDQLDIESRPTATSCCATIGLRRSMPADSTAIRPPIPQQSGQ
jgi:hypothetical protein